MLIKIITTLFVIASFAFVSTCDYDDAVNAAKMYCDNVEIGVHGNYKNIKCGDIGNE